MSLSHQAMKKLILFCIAIQWKSSRGLEFRPLNFPVDCITIAAPLYQSIKYSHIPASIYSLLLWTVQPLTRAIILIRSAFTLSWTYLCSAVKGLGKWFDSKRKIPFDSSTFPHRSIQGEHSIHFSIQCNCIDHIWYCSCKALGVVIPCLHTPPPPMVSLVLSAVVGVVSTISILTWSDKNRLTLSCHWTHVALIRPWYNIWYTRGGSRIQQGSARSHLSHTPQNPSWHTVRDIDRYSIPITMFSQLLSLSRWYSCISTSGSMRQWARIGAVVSAKINRRMTKTRFHVQKVCEGGGLLLHSKFPSSTVIHTRYQGLWWCWFDTRYYRILKIRE